jgi:hypothetical protein
MIQIPSWVLWLTACIVLVIADRIFRTGHILSAIGGSCIGGAVIALTGLGLKSEIAVVTLLVGVSLYSTSLKLGYKMQAGVKDERDSNVIPLLHVILRITPIIKSFAFFVVLSTFILSILVSIISASDPTSESLITASACGVLVGFIAKRYTDTVWVIAFWGSIGLTFGGLIFTVLIAFLRHIVHN